MTNYSEKEMLVDYVNARKRYDELKSLASQAYTEVERATEKLLEYMEDIGTTSTAKYEGLGRVKVSKPILSVKFDEEHRKDLYDYLRREGLEDCIKESVHHATLSSIIRQKIQEGENVPEFIIPSYRKNITLTQ